MAKFKYKAINARGETIQGVYEGKGKEEVLSVIASNGYSPLNIEEIIGSQEISFGSGKSLNKKDIAVFCRQLATMIRAGVTIISAINLLSEQIPNKKFRSILIKVNNDIQKGEELSVAMSKFPKDFPTLLVSMIEVGEKSGTLDSVMERMADYYEKQNKLNGKLKNAMIYPAILAIVTVAVMIFMLTYVMPMFIDMFSSSGAELPIVTKAMLATSDFLRKNGFILTSLISIIIIFGYHYLCKVESGIMIFSRYKLKNALLKDLNQKTVVSRFARGLATVLGSGMTLSSSLDIVSSVVDNKYAEAKLETVMERVMTGYSLADSVRESHLFPEMLSSMMKIGEESGQLDTILEKTADFYDDELERAIEGLTAILDPIMLIVMGVVIGFMVVSIITPMFQMYNVI